MPEPVPADVPPGEDAGPRDDLGTEVSVTNEFTSVRVRKVLTRNGERLRITAPKLGFAIDLDPLELESLTWQTADTFSRMLHAPYGPEEPVARRLLDLRDDRPGDGPPG